MIRKMRVAYYKLTQFSYWNNRIWTKNNLDLDPNLSHLTWLALTYLHSIAMLNIICFFLLIIKYLNIKYVTWTDIKNSTPILRLRKFKSFFHPKLIIARYLKKEFIIPIKLYNIENKIEKHSCVLLLWSNFGW